MAFGLLTVVNPLNLMTAFGCVQIALMPVGVWMAVTSPPPKRKAKFGKISWKKQKEFVRTPWKQPEPKDYTKISGPLVSSAENLRLAREMIARASSEASKCPQGEIDVASFTGVTTIPQRQQKPVFEGMVDITWRDGVCVEIETPDLIVVARLKGATDCYEIGDEMYRAAAFEEKDGRR